MPEPRRDRPDVTRTAAEVHVIADTVERQRRQVGALAEPYLGSDREDVVALLHEAERQLLMAARALTRALRTLEG